MSVQRFKLSRYATALTRDDMIEVVSASDYDALETRCDELEAKLYANKCNRGHETVPLILWDCPVCHDETRAERDQVQARVTELERDYAQVKEAYEAASAGVPLGPVIGAQNEATARGIVEAAYPNHGTSTPSIKQFWIATIAQALSEQREQHIKIIDRLCYGNRAAVIKAIRGRQP